MPARFNRSDAIAIWRTGLAWLEADGRGVAGSLALHGLLALGVLWLMLRAVAPPIAPAPFVPVEIVRLGLETVSPPAPIRAKIPQPFAPRTTPRPPAAANRLEGTSPTGVVPQDEMATRLNALSHLRQPQTNPQPLDKPAPSDPSASPDSGPGNDATYAVRDLIRAQVLRRWTFNAVALGTHSFKIALRVTVLRNGTVTKAEILDRERYTRDALYRDIALSARNAVLLSSPLTLPAGAFGDEIVVTLNLNPRDALR